MGLLLTILEGIVVAIGIGVILVVIGFCVVLIFDFMCM